MAENASTHPSVPPEKHLRHGLKVRGILKLGNDFLIEGDVIAPGGVIFGDNVTVEGDLFTDGEVESGADCTIHGTIRPMDESRSGPGPLIPEDDPPTRTLTRAQQRAAPPRVRERPPLEGLRFKTVEVTLRILWDLIWDEDPSQLMAGERPLPGMEEGAVEDLMGGIASLLNDTYRSTDQADEPWTPDELVATLYQRVVPVLMPVEVTRLEPNVATLEVARPTRIIPAKGSEGWPLRSVAFLELLGRSVQPRLRVDAAGGDATLHPQADPDRFWAKIDLT
ncbi:MAG: polymer-forming cytoskeletal protein [Candidatus Thermoplasmatota archaeon]|nr:polymer-forming cytoskeletal protein [Candidatus Thermoplasmatota archaeon]